MKFKMKFKMLLKKWKFQLNTAVFLFFPFLIFLIVCLIILDINFYKLKFVLAESFIFTLLFAGISLFIGNYKINRVASILIYIILSFNVFLFSSYYFLYGEPPGASAFFIIIESNFAEIIEFYSSYFNLFNLVLFTVLFFPLIIFSRMSKENYFQGTNILKSRLIFLFIIPFFLSLYYFKNLEKYNLYFNGWYSFKEYQNHTKIYDKLGLENSIGNFNDVTVASSKERQVFVLIIGESTTRQRMGLYGYPRNNNPLLSKIKNDIFIYDNVISPHTYTIQSLSQILTFKDYENKEGLKKGTLLQLMNQANFDTYWISNQRPVGIYENLVTKISNAADFSYFLNNSNYHSKTPYDEVVLKPLKEVLRKKSNSFIIIHLLGTHSSYDKRYPDSYSKFFGKAPLTHTLDQQKHDVINAYDNAILYNDKVIYNIIEEVKKQNASSFVLYISDHGEDVYQINDSASHTVNLGTHPMYDVPFILWTSKKFKNKGNFKYEIKRKFMLDNLIYSIADLSGITFEEYIDEKSIFSKEFSDRKRIIYNNLIYDSIFRK